MHDEFVSSIWSIRKTHSEVRLVDAELLLDGRGGQPDLAAHDARPCGLPCLVQLELHGVARLDIVSTDESRTGAQGVRLAEACMSR